MPKGTRVYLEVGGKRTFASAADWPGWSRAGKTPEAALEALASYAPRYAPIPKLARIEFPRDATKFDVVERLEGNATTDFGAPGIPAKSESKTMTAAEHARLISLLEACWKYLDRVVANAPAELRKGPRGGGRDRDKMFQHVLDAELEYGKGIGERSTTTGRKAMSDGVHNPK